MKHCYHFDKPVKDQVAALWKDQEVCCRCGDYRWVDVSKSQGKPMHQTQSLPNCEFGGQIAH